MNDMSKPFLQTLAGMKGEQTPLWFMRQAGRYLPEYKEVRKTTRNFLEFCYSPEKAAEVTLQPIRRFDMDAAIIFSDILVIPHALGMEVSFVENEGPKIKPLETASCIEKLTYDTTILDPVYEALRLTRQSLAKEKALIGFAGAPWTLATYMIEGGSSRDFIKTKLWAYRDPSGFARIMDMLSRAVITHCIAQVKAGVEVIQLFDSWAGVLTPEQFRQYAIDPVSRIVQGIRAACPDIPIIGFPKGAGVMLPEYVEKTEVNAVSIDQHMSCDWAVTNIRVPIQGNLDPVLLMADKNKAVEQTKKILESFVGHPHVFNLGHGILQHTPIDHVEAVVKTVREFRA